VSNTQKRYKGGGRFGNELSKRSRREGPIFETRGPTPNAPFAGIERALEEVPRMEGDPRNARIVQLPKGKEVGPVLERRCKGQQKERRRGEAEKWPSVWGGGSHKIKRRPLGKKIIYHGGDP